MKPAHLQHDDELNGALADLSQQHTSPDLTRSIMGRLGYMRVNRQVARRRRLMRWTNCAGGVMVVAIAFSIGWRVFPSSPHARRPAQVTIPQAISSDVQRQQQRVGTMIRTIRSIPPPRLEPGMDRADPSFDELQLPGDPSQTPDGLRELRDDVNRESLSPVRWV